jgi:peptide/nickel transport system substrate-binding protein
MAIGMFKRRQFLSLSAALAAGAAISACGGSNATSPPASTAPSSAAASSAASSSAAASSAAASSSTAASSAGPAATLAVGGSNATPVTQAQPGTFKEAPMLADKVKAGQLPSVEQRLPKNPRVIKPLDQVGTYGGTWRGAYRGLSDRVGPTKQLEENFIEWDAPDPNTIRVISNIPEKWEQNADASEYTFYLRQGMRWSNGDEVTTDDVKFTVEDINYYKDICPSPNYYLRQRIGSEFKTATLTVVDKYTFKVKYEAPFPLLPIQMAKLGGGKVSQPGFLMPSAYLKKLHPKYASQADLQAAVTKYKVQGAPDLWGKAGELEGPAVFWFLNPELPVLYPWKIVSPTPAEPVVEERNPYYWQVDTEGNQLPYIDRIEYSLFENNDVLNLRVAGGQIDMQQRHMTVGTYTFYKENEAKGNYTVVRWRAASTDAYYFNICCPDPVLAKIFDTPEFRQAASIAIDRKEINELVWNGLGSARQASPVKGSPEYDPELEQKWAEYDAAKANQLLDQIGLAKGPDGFRRRPDGKTLELNVEHISIAGSPEEDQHNRVKAYWEAVGLKTNVKFVERSLYEQRYRNSEIEVGNWSCDRCSVVKADPGRWLGYIGDGPWAPAYGFWYDKQPYKQIEPPADHIIRKMWDNWDKCQVEPDEAKRNALFQDILNLHKQAPYQIGVNGEKVVPTIVSKNFKNFREGYVADDTLRDIGLLNPQQYFIAK